ncbi:MAG TPA: hypothetical protein VLI41_07015 [Phenylobacterium sp.]|uniref:hypothetical protein n=1 Tax=Phenylobacterium sp. TaxID=1871053 RepID=UPI002CE0E3B4|nr:hypothetical protein [Phenylobacterium sp.]HSV02942.1 hypothetical protein [Phenylobacterium sp.]
MSYPPADDDPEGPSPDGATRLQLQSRMTRLGETPAIRLRAAGEPAWDSGVLVVLSLRLFRRLLVLARAVRLRRSARRGPRRRLDIRV